MKALVTGAAGFVGSHLCERLIQDGFDVVGLDSLATGSLSNLSSLASNPSFHFMGKDVRDLTEIKVDVIFHLAALADIVPSIEKPLSYHGANVTGTINILEVARKAKVKKFVYAASSSCYGIPESYPTTEMTPCDPRYPYALTKYMGEQYVMHWANVYKIPAISLRLFNVYGPRARTSGAYGAVFGVFLSQLANAHPLTIVGDGTQKRDFTFVTDVVDAFVKAALSSYEKTIFNVGSERPASVNELADLLGAKERIHIPKRPGEPDITWAACAKIHDMLKWFPKVTFEAGAEKMKSLIPEFKEAPIWTKEKIEKATEPWFKYLKGDGNASVS